MATVFMKWLETNPQTYERGIQLLTLGRLRQLRERIAGRYTGPGKRVLEIGCGTGALSQLMAERGATITAIDASPLMLAEAQARISAASLETQVSLRQMDATTLLEHLPPGQFDLIVSSLVFSELPVHQQEYVLRSCRQLLAGDGRLLIVDEIIPASRRVRLLYYLVRLPLVLLTWLLTRTSTLALDGFDDRLVAAGFQARRATSLLGGTLVMFEAQPRAEPVIEESLPVVIAGQLRPGHNWRTLLIDLWALFFRIIPPYPKKTPGLYAVGRPDQDSPVLVTGNFDVTVRRVVAAIYGQLDAWLLVADSAGINVWCAAGGGYFTAEKVIAAVNASQLSQIVRHRALILPQLCANGVDGWRVRDETGWGVHWGPARATDLPAYLAAGRKKNEVMRRVDFPLKARLEMVTVTLGFYGLLILLPIGIFWRTIFWPAAISLAGLSYFYAIVHPWLPGQDGLLKSIPLTLIALAGLWVYQGVWRPLPLDHLFNWTIALTGLSVFTGAELQGMSPLMRGEQANWGWEAIIGSLLALVYWLVPRALGW